VEVGNAAVTQPALRLQHVSKRFGGVIALDDVSIDVAAGEVHSIVGQNGSGKSTLIKIIAGYHLPDPGAKAVLWGREVIFPLSGSYRHGLATIHQDLGLVDHLTVAENLGVSAAYGTRGLLPISWANERRRTRDLFRRFGVEIDPDMHVGSIGPAARAMLAILRALRQLEKSGNDRVLLALDEPTVYLPRDEVAQLISMVRALVDQGGSVIFVSHRLREVLAISDRVSVIRDGKIVGSMTKQDADDHTIVRMMIGRDLGSFFPDKAPPPRDDERLRVVGLSGSIVKDLSFAIRAGEVLGITGLAGMGQDEIPYLIVGATKARGGAVFVDGAPLSNATPSRALARGVIVTPGNRISEGGWLDASATENVTLPILKSFSRRGFLRVRAELERTRELMNRFGVSPLAPRLPLRGFSGGNQQKLILAKWLQAEPGVFLLHEPTQGVDAAAKKEILRLIAASAEHGVGVVIFSSDYEQLANVCHRVIVLQDGRFLRELEGAMVEEQRIVEACHAA